VQVCREAQKVIKGYTLKAVPIVLTLQQQRSGIEGTKGSRVWHGVRFIAFAAANKPVEMNGPRRKKEWIWTCDDRASAGSKASVWVSHGTYTRFMISGNEYDIWRLNRSDVMLGGNTNPHVLPLFPILLQPLLLLLRCLASHFMQLTAHSHLSTLANGPSFSHCVLPPIHCVI
jgi:hypothetical protein